MKKEKKNDVAALLQYAGSRRKLTFLGLILSAISMLLSMAPYICIWLAARDLIAVAYVYAPGCLPHSVKYPQAGCGTRYEGSAGIF